MLGGLLGGFWSSIRRGRPLIPRLSSTAEHGQARTSMRASFLSKTLYSLLRQEIRVPPDFQANGCGGDVRCYADLGRAGMNRRGHINCSLELKRMFQNDRIDLSACRVE